MLGDVCAGLHVAQNNIRYPKRAHCFFFFGPDSISPTTQLSFSNNISVNQILLRFGYVLVHTCS